MRQNQKVISLSKKIIKLNKSKFIDNRDNARWYMFSLSMTSSKWSPGGSLSMPGSRCPLHGDERCNQSISNIHLEEGLPTEASVTGVIITDFPLLLKLIKNVIKTSRPSLLCCYPIHRIISRHNWWCQAKYRALTPGIERQSICWYFVLLLRSGWWRDGEVLLLRQTWQMRNLNQCQSPNDQRGHCGPSLVMTSLGTTSY